MSIEEAGKFGEDCPFSAVATLSSSSFKTEFEAGEISGVRYLLLSVNFGPDDCPIPSMLTCRDAPSRSLEVVCAPKSLTPVSNRRSCSRWVESPVSIPSVPQAGQSGLMRKVLRAGAASARGRSSQLWEETIWDLVGWAIGEKADV
jgi:hypothetical protein